MQFCGPPGTASNAALRAAPPRGPMQFQPASAVMPQPHAMSPATTAAVRQPARPPNAGVPSSLIKKKKMQRIGQLQVDEAE